MQDRRSWDTSALVTDPSLSPVALDEELSRPRRTPVKITI